MPFPRSVARFNRTFTNRIARPLAARLPGLGVVTHVGRRSGRTYRTPVNVFRRPGGVRVALTYGQGDWVRNVLAAGGADLVTRGRRYRIANPVVVEDPSHEGVPRVVHAILRLINVNEFLEADRAPPA